MSRIFVGVGFCFVSLPLKQCHLFLCGCIKTFNCISFTFTQLLFNGMTSMLFSLTLLWPLTLPIWLVIIIVIYITKARKHYKLSGFQTPTPQTYFESIDKLTFLPDWWSVFQNFKVRNCNGKNIGLVFYVTLFIQFL